MDSSQRRHHVFIFLSVLLNTSLVYFFCISNVYLFLFFRMSTPPAYLFWTSDVYPFVCFFWTWMSVSLFISFGFSFVWISLTMAGGHRMRKRGREFWSCQRLRKNDTGKCNQQERIYLHPTFTRRFCFLPLHLASLRAMT